MMYTIYHEDCLKTMARFSDESIDLIVTSPPYNKGLHPKNGTAGAWSAYSRKIEYADYSDDMPQQQYEDWQRRVLDECMRILKPSGSMFYNHKESIANGLAIFPAYIYDYNVHQTIIWDRGSGLTNDPHHYQNRIEFLFWLVKDPKKTFFDKSKSAYRQNVWRINWEKNDHPAPFPVALAQNCARTCCPADGVIYDPFFGSGTTGIAAIREGVQFCGSDISQIYVDMAQRRINEELSQLSLFGNEIR